MYFIVLLNLQIMLSYCEGLISFHLLCEVKETPTLFLP